MMLVGNRRLLGPLAVVAGLSALCALGFPTQPLAQSATEPVDFGLWVNGRGHVVATIEDAVSGENTPVDCAQSPPLCPQRYRPGQVVTLRAESLGSASEFAFWSDDRCPQGPVCRLVVERDPQTVVASFSPQQVFVELSNETSRSATLTSEPAGKVPDDPRFPSCGSDQIEANGEQGGGEVRVWCREYPLSKEKVEEVVLEARGDTPFWGLGLTGLLKDRCDAVVGARCSLAVHSDRYVALNFGRELTVGEPNDFRVVFHVAKDGTGAGTIQSQSLDCGDRCRAELPFGARQNLAADAARGSHFVGWRGACATSPRCTLAVGPTTRVTAVFDTAETSSETVPSGTGSPPSKSQQSKRGRGAPARFIARVGRPVVRGARSRRIHFTIAVSARSSIRAVLANTRGRPVSSRTWKVRRGSRVLRLGIPKRTRRGTYVLRITARDHTGNTRRFNRRVHLDR
jgi:hypothetical protein